MNQQIVVAFLLVTISAVLAHPGIARDDAIASPVAIALDAAPPAVPEIPASAAPPAPVPEEQPTGIPALLDDATAQPVTLPAAQEGSVPASEGSSNDNVAIPSSPLI